MPDLTNMLAPFKARAEAATEGPWRTWIDDGERRGAAVETSWSHDADGSDTELITDWCSPADAAFIASARSDVPRLLAALEGVLALHKESRRHVEPWARGYKFSGDHCAHDGDHWPCPTVAAVVAALGEGK